MCKILCVEDDLDVAELIKRKLERKGYNILHAPNEQSASELVVRECPDLILLDFSLGGIRDGGWRFYRQLRDSPDTCQIPVIAVTGQAIGWDRARSLQEGLADHILKPIDFQILYHALEEHLKSTGTAL